MARVTVYGASDDLIEIEGDLTEEFGAYDEEEGCVVAFSEGTLLSVLYDQDGIWRIHRLVAGSAAYEKTEGTVDPDTGTDRVTLTGDLTWAVCARADRKVLAR